MRARFFTLKGQNEEMLRAIFGTLPLLGLSGLLMSIYISLALVKRGRFRKHSKIFVGAVGNMTVGIAAVMTFGICCGLGVDITPISQVVPFLLLGVGVDDMFVMCVLSCLIVRFKTLLFGKSSSVAHHIGCTHYAVILAIVCHEIASAAYRLHW